MTRVDKYGFPTSSSKVKNNIFGFKTGDFVRANVSSGKKLGVYVGRVVIRSRGYFDISNIVSSIYYKYFKKLFSCDGYSYKY